MNWTAFFATTTVIYGLISTAALLLDAIIREKGVEKSKARVNTVVFSALLMIPAFAVGLLAGWLE